MKHVPLWARLVYIAVAVPTMWYLWHSSFRGLSALVLAVAGIVVGRLAFQSRLTTNPFGEQRNYALRPVLVEAITAGALFAAGILWVICIALAVKHRVLPDNYISGGILLVPFFALLALGAIRLWKALFQSTFGADK